MIVSINRLGSCISLYLLRLKESSCQWCKTSTSNLPMSLTRLDSWLHPFGSLNRGKCGMQIVACGRGIEYSEEEEYGTATLAGKLELSNVTNKVIKTNS